MKYRTLGSPGLIVSRITLGTMTFGAPDWGCDEKTSHAILKKYIDMSGNHLDSADVYAGGKAEEIIGVKNVSPLETDMEPADWDMPEDVWNTLEKETRPDEEYLTWFNKRNYERIFATAEFHDERMELP